MRPVKRADMKRAKRKPLVTGLEGSPEEAPKPGSDADKPGTSGTGFSRDVQIRVLLAQQREWRALDKLAEDVFATLDPDWTPDGEPYKDRNGNEIRMPLLARLKHANARASALAKLGAHVAQKQPKEREAYGIDLRKFGGVDQASAEQHAEGLAMAKRMLEIVKAIKQGVPIEAQAIDARIEG